MVCLILNLGSSSFTVGMRSVLSSAYIRHDMFIGRLEVRWFMYIKNKSGPEIDPWGTPCFHVLGVDFGALSIFLSKVLISVILNLFSK